MDVTRTGKSGHLDIAIFADEFFREDVGFAVTYGFCTESEGKLVNFNWVTQPYHQRQVWPEPASTKKTERT